MTQFTTIHISKQTIENLKPFLEEIYYHKIRYDKSTKFWHVVTPEELVEEHD